MLREQAREISKLVQAKVTDNEEVSVSTGNKEKGDQQGKALESKGCREDTEEMETEG